MGTNQAIEIIDAALKIAQSKGIFVMEDSATVLQAINLVKIHFYKVDGVGKVEEPVDMTAKKATVKAKSKSQDGN